jgi:general secretion pathway protein L
MSKLIVSLPYPNLSPLASDRSVTSCNYVLSNDAQKLSKSGVSALHDLPKADATILVVPASALSWHQVDLPKVPKARLRAALDGLLEERLLDDTNAMAFALSPEAQAAKPGKIAAGVWVAACDKTWLSSALQALDTAGCRVTQVVPEFWPQNEVSVCVTGTIEEAWITRADAQGVMTFPFYGNDTNGVMDVLLADLPDATPIFAAPAVVALAESSLTHKVQLRQFDYGLLQSATSLWELAQFEQSLNGDSQSVKNIMRRWQNFWQSPAWRPARWGLAVLLLANIVGLNAWAWQQKASLSAKRTQVNQILTQAFPSVKVVVDAPQQMAREMTLLRQTTGASGIQNFESMLHAFISSNSNLSVEFTNPSAIEYIANSTNFKGMKLTDNDVTAAQTKLKTMGYALTMNGDTATVKVQGTP